MGSHSDVLPAGTGRHACGSRLTSRAIGNMRCTPDRLMRWNPVCTGEAVLDALTKTRSILHRISSLPPPGHGATTERWRFLSTLARVDLSVVRLAEGHADARAILAELGREDLCGEGSLLGVWAADPGALRAEPVGDGWFLHGTKRWCSGSTGLDGALVTATAADGARLFLVPTSAASLTPQVGSWQPIGMAATRSETITFDRVLVPSSNAVGDAGEYVGRPGFGHGGAGVAACWLGGALGVLDGLQREAAEGRADAGALGSSAAMLSAAGHTLRSAACAIDAAPLDLALSVHLAAQVRLAVAHAARTTIDQSIDALGASGLCQMPEHSGRVADLLVYLGQHRSAPAAEAFGQTLLASPLPSW